MNACPFCTGYRDVTENTVWDDPTPGEVEAAHPEYTPDDVDRYINGARDALRSDAWRMTLHLGHVITPDSRCPLSTPSPMPDHLMFPNQA